MKLHADSGTGNVEYRYKKSEKEVRQLSGGVSWIDYTTRNLYPRVDANVSPLIDVFKIHDFSLLCNEYLK